ncbi:recombinase family protein, partial [Salmonella enterica]
MLIGYARVSKADGSQSLDLQHDALRAAGVERDNIYDGTVAKLAMRQPFVLFKG